MSNFIAWHTVDCPYCGFKERIELSCCSYGTEKQLHCCNLEAGGCDKYFVIESKIEIKSVSKKIAD